ncbi:hypothetical protein R5R35_004646 [Gryllus longicercus]|uniref:Uncharacterized protein n=1 Tax=Gryllus longicercus TaxID=2509291 RepID=A0AAN9W8L1_9ORTH
MWQDVALGGPPRFGHASAAVGPLVFTFGGYVPRRGDQLRALGSPLPPIEVFVFDTRSGESEALPPAPEGSEQFREVPRRRIGHSAVAFEGAIFVWGGVTEGPARAEAACVFRWDVRARAWSRVRVEGAVPAVRSRHAACVSRGRMLVLGGRAVTGPLVLPHDVPALDLRRMRWTRLHPPPAPLAGGAPDYLAVADERGRVYTVARQVH